MDRYSEVTNKNQREIVLLKAFPCKWGKCSFCDYILDNSNDEEEINKLKTIEDVKEYLFTHLNELEKGIVNTYKKSIKESLEDFGAGIEAKKLPLATILGSMSIENNIQDIR